MSYGPDDEGRTLEKSAFIDTVLSEADAVAAPDFRLVLNLPVAKQAGLTFPKTMEAQAHEILK
ncbi:MAG: hypothetical protein ABI612_19105 [Betaproteobacteria bacterium]